MKYFRLIKALDARELEELHNAEKTLHIKDRAARLAAYNTSQYLYGFVVDKQHPNGLEIHVLDENGYIHVFNKRTRKLITVLSGRPAQIKRYFKAMPSDAQQALRAAAARNKATGENYF